MKLNWEYIEANIGTITILSMTVIVLFLIINLVSIGRIYSFDTKTVAGIDVNEIMTGFINVNKTKNLSEQETNILVDQFTNKLTRAIKEKAGKEKLIFIPRQAIIAGGKDYTEEIKQEVLQGL
ncbi:MAG: TrbI F-type domain-containing protein [Rickettsiaceae bacterium]|nr:TrbI F-type domain-containing protein [Rickettsiaceae bacterium]